MTWPDRIGTARYYQTLGSTYAELLRGSMTASGVVTAGAAWLGMGKAGALALGVGSVLLWPTLAIAFGWAVWRYRVVHRTLEATWRNDPLQLRIVGLLEEIAKNTHPARQLLLPDGSSIPRGGPAKFWDDAPLGAPATERRP